jgi:hypothetical protein
MCTTNSWFFSCLLRERPDTQQNAIAAFNDTSRYLDDILNLHNNFFDSMVPDIYPPELKLNRANSDDKDAPFLDLHLQIINHKVHTKIDDKKGNLFLKDIHICKCKFHVQSTNQVIT